MPDAMLVPDEMPVPGRVEMPVPVPSEMPVPVPIDTRVLVADVTPVTVLVMPDPVLGTMPVLATEVTFVTRPVCAPVG